MSTTTYKTLIEAQLGFVFSVPQAGGEEAGDKVFALQDSAYHAIEAAFRLAAPAFERKDTVAEVSYQPYELCEKCYELELADGRVELSAWFVSGSDIPLEDAKRLRTLCEQAYQATAGALALEIRYERAESHRAFRVSERSLYAGV